MTPTVRSDRFGILSSALKCHACKQETPVKALVLLGGQWRHDPDDDDDENPWYRIGDAALLQYVQEVSQHALTTWRQAAPWVQYMPSRTAGISYWSNTCIHCGALQGDHYLTEADGPFFPTTPDLVARIRLEWAEGPIEALATTSESAWLDDLAVRSARYA